MKKQGLAQKLPARIFIKIEWGYLFNNALNKNNYQFTNNKEGILKEVDRHRREKERA